MSNPIKLQQIHDVDIHGRARKEAGQVKLTLEKLYCHLVGWCRLSQSSGHPRNDKEIEDTHDYEWALFI